MPSASVALTHHLEVMSTSSSRSAVIDDPLSDERWQLVQRIVVSPPFQKSGRLRDLLHYVTEQTINGCAHELTEQYIGEALFHKPSGYSPLEDSSVRVHARQLRLKLHEYFDGVGRDEPLVLEIPKGTYAPVFRLARPVESQSTPVEPPIVPVAPKINRMVLPWTLCGVLAVFCVVLLVSLQQRATSDGANAAAPPWPFAQILDTHHQTIVVVADGNYGMLRILTGQHGSLEGYLNGDVLQNAAGKKLGQVGSQFVGYLSDSTLTSFADVADAVSVVKIAGALQKQVTIRSAKDMRIRDLDHENYIFIGSPASNPWVSLFQDKLNFRETETEVGKSVKAFLNTKPLPGEQARYEGLRWTGTEGEDYATVALLPNLTQDGSVLILQGLQQEGTEAAGRFLVDAEGRRQLQRALGVPDSGGVTGSPWFEALIRSRTVSGAPNSTTLVAIRRIH
ncbi:MAG: hypothetical protein ACM34E_16755 [Acidobacteriota bacterium]